ncbi:Tat pathway signal sequence domain protein [Cellulomonas timonensis]|uniref:Tat pathway signal sequence domain protein n=1 Tax=Cellulomonas timonensis TaxID=1689271 RepID=UPI00083547CC|nr:Tat pathway signal sequence domain protein [Cellulomonas timonensis]
MSPTASPSTASPSTARPFDGAGRSLSRRGFLAATGAGAAAVWLGGAAASSATAAVPGSPRPLGSGHGSRGSESAALGFLRSAADAYPAVNSGPRLAQSYADELGLFSTAFVYDNALAICALLSARRGVDPHARALGDGLLFAQDHDPDFADGRLRQAYNVGPYTFYDGSPQPDGLVRADGAANVGWQFGFLGTAVGDMAWPGIALVQLYERTRDRRHLDGAVRIAEWIVDRTTSAFPLGGYTFGVNGADESIPNGSTEHNIDVTAFFTLLHQVGAGRRWKESAKVARAFVERMWEPAGGYFYTGTNDGTEINRAPLPLDPQTWSWLALREKRYAKALDWAAGALAARDVAGPATSQMPAGAAVSGVTFSSASLESTARYNDIQVHPQGVWLEGTAQLATAFADRGSRGDKARAQALSEQVRVAQQVLGGGQHLGGSPLPAGGGVVAASSLIDTGFGFGYFQVQHVGATSWHVMGSRGANPFVRDGLS